MATPGSFLGGVAGSAVGQAVFELATDTSKLSGGLAEAVAESKAAVSEGSGDIQIGVDIQRGLAELGTLRAALAGIGTDTSKATDQTALFDMALLQEAAAAREAAGQMSLLAVATDAAGDAQRRFTLGQVANAAALSALGGGREAAPGAGDAQGGGGGILDALGGFAAGRGGGGRGFLGGGLLMPRWLRRAGVGAGAFSAFMAINPTAAELGAVAALTADLTLAIGAFAGVAAGIAVVTVQMGQLKEAITGQAPPLDKYLGVLKQGFANAGQTIQDAFTGPTHQGLSLVTGAVLVLTHQVTGLVTSFGQQLAAGGGQLFGFLLRTTQTWMGLIAHAFSGVGTGLLHLWSALQPAAVAIFNGITGLFHSIAQTGAGLLGPVAHIVAPFITQFFGLIGNLVAAWAPLSAAFEHAAAGLMQFVNATVAALIPAVQGAVPLVSALATGLGGLGHILSLGMPAVGVGVLPTLLGGFIGGKIITAGLTGIASLAGKAAGGLGTLADSAATFGAAGLAETLGAASGAGEIFAGSLAGLAVPLGIAGGLIAGVTLGVSTLIAHFRAAALARHDLFFATTIAPEVAAGNVSPGQLINILTAPPRPVPRSFLVPAVPAFGAPSTAAAPIPGFGAAQPTAPVLGFGVTQGTPQQQRFGLAGPLALSSQEWAKIMTTSVIPAMAAGTITTQQFDRAAAAAGGTLSSWRQQLHDFVLNQDAAAKALHAYDQALQAPTVSQAKAVAGLHNWITVSGQSRAEFVAAAQSVADSSQKSIQWIQQQDQAYFKLGDTVAAAFSTVTASQGESVAKYKQSLDKLLTEQHKWAADQKKILDEAGSAAKPWLISMAQQGPAALSVLDGAAHKSAGYVRGLVGEFNRSQTGGRALGQSIVSQLVGPLRALNVELAKLLVSLGGPGLSERLKRQIGILPPLKLRIDPQIQAMHIDPLAGALQRQAALIDPLSNAVQSSGRNAAGSISHAITHGATSLGAAIIHNSTSGALVIRSQIVSAGNTAGTSIASKMTASASPIGSAIGSAIASAGASILSALANWRPPKTKQHQYGGWVTEPVYGYGLYSGQPYSFAEHGPEHVAPQGHPGQASIDYRRLGKEVANAMLEAGVGEHGHDIYQDGYRVAVAARLRQAVMR